MANVKTSCPKCKSTHIAKIVYGLPVFSEELQKDIDDGNITLGGCVIGVNDPRYHCNDCNTDFGQKDSA